MTNVFDPIIVRIEDATSTPGGNSGGGASPSGSAKGGAKGSLAGLTAGITGIAMIVSEIAGLVKGAVDGVLKPVRVMLSGILKLIAQLLRPVVDVVMLMLMPILQFLKPIIRVANEIMRPFRTLAYGFMRMANNSDNAVEGRGLQQLAMTTIMAGIGNVLIGISGELIKMIGGIVLDILGHTILMSRDKAELLKSGLNDVVDGIVTWVSAQSLAGLMRAGMEISSAGEKEIVDMANLFERVLGTARDDVASKIEEMDFYKEINTLGNLIQNEEINITTKFSSIGQTIRNGMADVGDGLEDSIKNIIRRAERAARLSSGSSVSRIGDFDNPAEAIEWANNNLPRRRLITVKTNGVTNP